MAARRPALNDILYLYGFVPPEAPTPPRDLAGVGGSPVEVLEVAGIRTVVSRVGDADYAPGVVERRMADLSWVGDQAAVHERVVTWFVDHATIVPVRLLTLYSGPAALEEGVRERRGGILRELERFRGLREWDLKVGYRADVLRGHLGEVSAEIAAMDREIAAAPPGRRYLLERKREKRVEAEIGRAARRLANDVLEEARPLAAGMRTLTLPRDSPDLPVVLAAALLADVTHEPELWKRMAEARIRLEPVGVRVSFTGPWAPYRFLADAEAESGPGAGDASTAEEDASEPPVVSE